jgi:hypothetical protein
MTYETRPRSAARTRANPTTPLDRLIRVQRFFHKGKHRQQLGVGLPGDVLRQLTFPKAVSPRLDRA